MAWPWSATAPPGGPASILGLLTVQGLARAREALVDLRQEVRERVGGAGARFGVHGSALPAVDGDACPRDEVQLCAQHRARPADLPQRLQGGLAQGRHRRVIRPERLSQPHSLDMPVGLLCQTTTRPQGVERAVQGELPQISRVRGRPACGSGGGALDAQHREGEVIATGIQETAGMLFGHVVVEPRREQDGVVAVRAVEKTHERTKLPKSKNVSRDREPCDSLPKHGVFTQSGAGFGPA